MSPNQLPPISLSAINTNHEKLIAYEYYLKRATELGRELGIISNNDDQPSQPIHLNNNNHTSKRSDNPKMKAVGAARRADLKQHVIKILADNQAYSITKLAELIGGTTYDTLKKMFKENSDIFMETDIRCPPHGRIVKGWKLTHGT